MKKKLFASVLLASFLGIGVASSSFASGPIVVGPAPAPAVPPATIVKTSPIQTKILNTYRQVRAFWLSRAIVR